jgi:hypothetical protein
MIRAPRRRMLRNRRGPPFCRPRLEPLEDRVVLDTVYWKAATSGNWNNAANWNTHLPGSGDIAIINATGANYTVTLDVDAVVAGFNLNSANATFASTSHTFTVSGPALLSAGAVTWTKSTWGGVGSLTNGAANMTVFDSSAINCPFAQNGTLLIQSTNTVTSSLTVSSGFYNGGTLTLDSLDSGNQGPFLIVNGRLTNQANATLNLNGTGVGTYQDNLYADLTNNGTMNVNRSMNLGRNHSDFTNAGTVTIAAGQGISMGYGNQTFQQTGVTFQDNGSVGLGGVTVTQTGGTVAVAGSMTLTDYFTNASYTMSGGTLQVNETLKLSANALAVNGGLLAGTGTVTGNVNNSGGNVRPGPASGQTGKLAVSDNYIQGSQNTYCTAEIGGTGAGTDYDQLAITGSAQLDGTLNVSLVNGFIPVGGQSFSVVTWGSRSGQFSTVNLPALPQDLSWDTVQYTNSALVLTVKAATVYWTNPVSGNWSDASRWSAGHVPSKYALAVIDKAGNYSVNLDVNATVTGFTLDAGPNVGFYAHLHNLTVTSTCNWTGGIIQNDYSDPPPPPVLTIAAGSTLNMSGSADKTLSHSTITNAGTATWSGTGNLLIQNESVINNQAGATFDVQNDQNIRNGYQYYTSTFNNAGTFKKSAGNGITTFTTVGARVQFNNTGTVQVQTGTLAFPDAVTLTSGGTFNVEARALVDLTGGTHTLTNGAVFTGAGLSRIAGASVNVATGATATVQGTLTLASGSIAAPYGAPGTLSVSSTGTLNWTGGSMTLSVTTLLAGSHLKLSGMNDKELDGAVLTNAGTATWSGTGNLLMQNASDQPSVITNQAGATFDVQNDQNIGNTHQYYTNIFNNAGTFKKSASTGTTTFTTAGNPILFNNTGGTLDIQTGTLNLVGALFNNSGSGRVLSGTVNLAAGGNSSGALDLAAGVAVNFTGGTQTVSSAGLTFTGAGLPHVAGATLSSAGPVSAVGFELASGTVSGSGNLTTNGIFTWTGGNLAIATNIAAAGRLNLSGTNDKRLDGAVLTNGGTATWSGTGNLLMQNGSVITNQAGATFEVQNDQNISNPLVYYYNDFNNAGTFRKSAGNGTTTFTTAGPPVRFNNTGTVQVQAGTLAFPDAVMLTSGGTFSVAANALVDLTGGTHTLTNGAVFSGAGLSRIAGATVNVATGATATVQGSFTLASGTLGGAGALSVNNTGTLNWTGGMMTGGVTTLLVGSRLNLSGANDKHLEAGAVLTNAGTATWSGTGDLLMQSHSMINNQAGATFDVQNDQNIRNSYQYDIATFNNAGTFRKSAGTGTTTFTTVPGTGAPSVRFYNTGGTLDIQTGTVFLSGYFDNFQNFTLTGGTYRLHGTLKFNNADIRTNSATVVLDGPAAAILSDTGTNALANFATNNGTFALLNGRNLTMGNFNNTGTLTIGAGCTFTVSGNYTQTATGTLDVQLGGSPASGQFGKLVVSGTATLDGTLSVSLVNNFSPSLGQSFTITTYSSHTGMFASTKLQPPGNGLAWQVQYNTGSVVLQVVQGVAISMTVSGFPSPITAGTAGSFQVTVKDQNGNLASGYRGTVHFTSSDPHALLPGDYTFTAADAGVHTFSATLKTAATQSITATDTVTGTLTGTQSGIVVNPAPVSGFVVLGFPSPIEAGTPGSVIVQTTDPYGNTLTDYRGTIHFSSSDTRALLPANYTYTAVDNGSHTFTATLNTPGTQSITATDINTGITGTQSGIVVTPRPAASLVVSGFPSPITAGTTGVFMVMALDDRGNPATGYTGTVFFKSTDPQAVLPPNYTFTAADSGVHTFTATLKTAGTQSLTATDTVTGSITGTQRGIVVKAGAFSGLVVAGFANPTTAGHIHTFTVTAADAYGNPVSYTGTVHFMSSDSQAVLPDDYTFLPSDNGSQTFGAVLKTAGTQSLTATDTMNNTGTQSGIVVNPAQFKGLLLFGYPSPVDAGDVNPFYVKAADAYGNPVLYLGTVHFTSSDPQAVLPDDYTFTATDNGVHAFAAILKTAGSQALTATDTVNGNLSATQTGILVVPADPSAFLVTGIASPTTAGDTNTMTVTVQDAFGNTVTDYAGTVHFSSSDLQADLPADYTFSAGDEGVQIFPVVLKTAGTQSVTVTDTANSGVTGTQTGIVVKPAAADHFDLRVPVAVRSGRPFEITVFARDAYGNVATGYTGTVTFTSSDHDPGVKLPIDYTFTANDQGKHSFPGGVTLITPGDQTVTATDTMVPQITGTATVTVGTGPGQPGGGSGPAFGTGAPDVPTLIPAVSSVFDAETATSFFAVAPADDWQSVLSAPETDGLNWKANPLDLWEQ